MSSSGRGGEDLAVGEGNLAGGRSQRIPLRMGIQNHAECEECSC